MEAKMEDRAGSDPARTGLQPVALPTELPIHFRVPTGVADGIQTHNDWGHIPAR